MACREGRRVVVLSEPRGGIAVLLKNLADGSYVLRDDAVVAGEARGLFGDHAEARRMMIATRDERRTRRRAERRRMKLRVTQSRLRDPVERRSGDNAPKGAWSAEANVIGHNEQHIGCTFGWYHTRCPPRFGLRGVLLYHASEFRVRSWELPPVNGRGGAGRTRRAGDLLGVGRYCRQQRKQGKSGCREQTSILMGPAIRIQACLHLKFSLCWGGAPLNRSEMPDHGKACTRRSLLDFGPISGLTSDTSGVPTRLAVARI